MGNVSLRELIRENKKLKDENWITVFRLIAKLDVFSVEKYHEEVMLTDFLREITNDKGLSFDELIATTAELDKHVGLELTKLFPIDMKNRYLAEFLKAIRLRADDKNIDEVNLENVFINFADLGITLFKELRFPSNEDTQSEAIIWEAIRNDNLQMVKAFFTNGELNIDLRNYYNESLLHLVANENAVNILRFLIENGLDINDESDEGLTPLHKALYSKGFMAAKLLIELGAKLNHQDNYGNTPIHIACYQQEMAIIKILIDHQSKLDLKNKQNEIPLSIAIMLDNVEMIDYLLQNGVNLKNYQEQVYFWVASFNSLKAFAYFMQLGIKPTNSFNNHNFSPLHISIYSKNDEITKLFIENGLDVNAKSKDLSTPLHLAAMVDSIEMAELLLTHQALPDAQNDKGLTPLHMAVDRQNLSMVTLLIKYHANLNIKSNQRLTPFYHSIYTRNLDLMKLLIDNGADINTVANKSGATPLHDACDIGDTSIVKLLIKNGASIDSLSTNGITPLNNAVLNNHYKVVKILIQNGALVDYTDGNVTTPLQTAVYKGYKKIADYLIINGANTAKLSRGIYKNKLVHYLYIAFLWLVIIVLGGLIIILIFLKIFCISGSL